MGSPSADLDALASMRRQSTTRPIDGRCTAARRLDNLPAEVAPTAAAAIVDREISSTVLIRWLEAHGVSVALTTLAAHRAGRCVCGNG